VRSYRQLDIPLSNEIWRAPIAAAVLGGLLTLFFNLVSCGVLAKKSVDRRGGGFGFGFVAAMCASLAFFSLLCGLVLDGFKDVVRSELQVKRKAVFFAFSVLGRRRAKTSAPNNDTLFAPPPTRPRRQKQTTVQDTWTQLNSGVYVATIALAYLCFVMFLLFFVALVVFQSAVADELGIAAAAAGGGGGGGLGGASPPSLRNPFAAHMAKKYEAFGPPSSGYDSPSGPRIPAVRTGYGPNNGGGGGMGAVAQTASPLSPPAAVMMAMPTPLPRAAAPGHFAVQQDSAL